MPNHDRARSRAYTHQSCSQCTTLTAPSEWPHSGSKAETSVWYSLSCRGLCAPTNEASPSDKDDFYQTLESAMLLTKTNDLVICLGDFNAVTGPRSTTPGPVGLFGSGSANDNSDRFGSFCQGAQLRIAGSWFRRKDIHCYTWFSNDGRTCKETDHILVNGRWSAVTNCRVYHKLEFNTDIEPLLELSGWG